MLSNGILNNDGIIDVAGTGNALDNETVTNTENIEVLGGGTLTLDLDTTVNNDTGQITVDALGTLTLNDASIDKGTVTVLEDGNGDVGTLHLTGSAVLSNGILNNDGIIDVTGTGNKLDTETVTNTETITVLAGGTLNPSGSSTPPSTTTRRATITGSRPRSAR